MLGNEEMVRSELKTKVVTAETMEETVFHIDRDVANCRLGYLML